MKAKRNESQLSFGAIIDRLDSLKEKETAEEIALAERFEAAAKSALGKLHRRQAERRERILNRGDAGTKSRVTAYLHERDLNVQ